jgi:3-deoxy-7-phosphoheptulonate synthase
MIEVHNQPEEALSDGNQAIEPPEFLLLMNEIRQIASVLNRSVAPSQVRVP